MAPPDPQLEQSAPPPPPPRSKQRLETILAQAGTHYQDAAAGVSSRDVVQPIHLASTYERGDDGLAYPGGFIYSRHTNPTRTNLEAVLTEIEAGAEWSAAFASGMAAANAILQAFGPGSFLLMPNDLYHGVRYLVQGVFGAWGLPFLGVDMSDLEAVAAALRTACADQRTTRVLLWMESPSNPLLQVTDIPAVLELAHQTAAQHGKEVISVADITWLTPYLIQPLALGVDLSLSSGTKYMGGHSDLLAGVVSGRRAKPSVVAGGGDNGVLELEQPIRHVQTIAGAVLAPFDAWLLMRGLKTLACRMRVHCDNALRLARFLAQHPAVECVHFPGLPAHPGHETFAKTLARPGMYGSMISVQIRGGQAGALRFVSALRVFRRATSLGSTESLVEHRASVEGPVTSTPPNLVRVSVGIEAYEDLEADLRQALEAL